MAIYQYRAKDSTGQVQKGIIEAGSLSEATAKLREQHSTILELAEGKPFSLSISFFKNRVSLKDKIIFTRQLSVMIKAGLPIIKALEALGKQTDNAYFKKIIAEISTQVKGGKTLSKTLERYPGVFPEIYVAVVRAGEETGQLADVLLNLADQQEKDADLVSKIKSAMIYPAVILVTLIGVVILIIFFVLPNLQAVFADSGAKLPLATRLLLSTSSIIQHYFLFVAVFFAALYFAFRYWVKRPSGRSFYDKLKITLPVFGPLTKKVYMARFARTMAMLTRASLPILLSLKIIRKTINNHHYDMAFERIEKSIESGKSLSVSLQQEPLFPAMVGQLSSLGEEAGSIEGVFIEIANFYDKEVNAISSNLSTLLEPVMLIVMGVGVAFVVFAVIQPIYGLVQNYGG